MIQKKSFPELLDLKDDKLQRPEFLDNTTFYEGTKNNFSIIAQGAVSIYSDSSFRLTPKDDVNINSQKNINIVSSGSSTSSSRIDCNIKAGENITVSADKTFKIELARSHFLMTNDGKIRIKAEDLEFDIGNRIILLSELEFIIRSAKVNIN